WLVGRNLLHTADPSDHRADYPPPHHDPRGPPSPRIVPREPYAPRRGREAENRAAVAATVAPRHLRAGPRAALATVPYETPERRRSLAATASTRPDLVVHGVTDRAHALIAGARAAVTMGGYNSVCELLAARCPALAVPRTVPRMEQAVRAAALARVGWVDTLH